MVFYVIELYAFKACIVDFAALYLRYDDSMRIVLRVKQMKLKIESGWTLSLEEKI